MPVSPLSAALAVAMDHGLPTRDARVLRDLTNVLVHLSPAPVVARVPITLARLRDQDWFAQEIELAGFLAERGAPVAPPADAVDPGPHEHGGRLVCFWAYVDHDPKRFDPAAAGHSLHEFHDELADYTEPLPTCDRLDEVRTLLERLEPCSLLSAGELGVLRDLASSLRPVEGGRPLHGDSHSATSSGRARAHSGATSRTPAAVPSSTTSPASTGAAIAGPTRPSPPTAPSNGRSSRSSRRRSSSSWQHGRSWSSGARPVRVARRRRAAASSVRSLTRGRCSVSRGGRP